MIDERVAVCRLIRTAGLLLDEVVTRNSAEWTLALQLRRDLAVVESALGGYCDDVPERVPGGDRTGQPV